jgi:ABC-type hemin transport system ATPase subunit
MLLNHRIIAIGSPGEVLRPENLLAAYGGHLHVIDQPDGALVVTDTCCEGE